MALYFSEQFSVDLDVLETYGAFDVSVVSDLPLFVDPFLLFNSEKTAYQALHEGIVKYLIFLRDHATDDLTPDPARPAPTSWAHGKDLVAAAS